MNLDDPLDRSRPSWRLYNRLTALGVTVDEASELMNGYAHELAERQRAAADGVMDRWFGQKIHQDALAELIAVTDPEVN